MRTHQASPKKSSAQKAKSPTPNPLASRPFAVQPKLEETTRSHSTKGYESPMPEFAILNPEGGRTMPVQPKLAIGAPGDKYEQEADRVAQQVVQRINAPQSLPPNQQQTLQRQDIPEDEDELQMKPELTIQRQEIPEGEELQRKPMLQLRADQGGMAAATSELESSIQRLRGSGQPLSDRIREPMERAFGGVNFSGVKVHTNAQSDQLNQSIQAKAFTTGQDIFFRHGAYKPENRGGQELIAHELTHVVQQNGGVVQRSPMPGMVKLGDRVGLASPLSPLSEGLIQRAKIETHALNNDPQPDASAPNCFMAVLTWLHATFDITDAGTIINNIIDKGGPSILMQNILAKAKKLKRSSEQEDQLRVTPGRIIIFAANGSPRHAAVSTSPLQITGYNQTHWFGQAANQYSHSVLEGVRWTSKDTIQNYLGQEENVYEIEVGKAAKAVGIANG